MHQRRGTSSRGRNGLKFIPSRKLPLLHATERKMCQSFVQKIFYLKTFDTMLSFLPPASEGWGKVQFSQVCLFTFRGVGYPHPFRWGVRKGSTTIQGQAGGTPIPGQDRGYPHPRSGRRDPPNWNTTACTYVVGGMPLAFTQEDFLVHILFEIFEREIS